MKKKRVPVEMDDLFADDPVKAAPSKAKPVRTTRKASKKAAPKGSAKKSSKRKTATKAKVAKENTLKEKPKRGRPPHPDDYDKVTVALTRQHVALLDSLSTEIRVQTGKVFKRSEIIRDLIDAAGEAEIRKIVNSKLA